MQISDLLKRLTTQERAALISVRRVPPQTAANDKALIDYLSAPNSVAAACADLNVFQFRLLEWLSLRPSQRANWTELQWQLSGSVPNNLLVDYLTHMRRLGLLDFKITERQGFVETYPAAVAVLPSARRGQLGDLLKTPSAETLGRMCAAAGVKNAPKTKDSRINALVQVLTDPERVRDLVSRLSAPAQELFSEMVERSVDILVDEMWKRFGTSNLSYYSNTRWRPDSLWGFSNQKGEVDPLTELMRCGLAFGEQGFGAYWTPSAYFVPAEVRLAYTGRSFFDRATVTMPELQRAEGVGGDAPNIGHLVRDVGHLLGFVASGQCEWKLDGEPYKRSLTAFGKLIGRTDDRYLQNLWELALGGGLIHQSRTADLQNKAPYDVSSVGKASPKEVFHRVILGFAGLHQVTLQRGGAFSFIDNPGWRLLSFVQRMPPDEWLTAPSIASWLQFRWPVTYKPALIGLSGTPIDPFAGVAELVFAQARSGNEFTAIMVPSAVYDALDPDLSRQSTALPPWEHSYVVQPDRTIVAPPNLHLDALVDLWKIATLESNHGAAVFRLSTQSISAALNLGLTPKQIRAILTEHSRGPLPSTVERLIDDQSARYGRIKVGAAMTFVQTDEPGLLDELRRNPKLKNLTWIDVVPGVAFVQGSSPDDVIAALRKAGQLPVRAEAEKEKGKKTGPGPDGTTALQVVGSHPLAPKEIRRLVRRAIDEDRVIFVTHGRPGKQKREELLPIDLHSNELHAERLNNGREVEIDFATISAIELGPEDDIDDDEYLDVDPRLDAEMIEALNFMLRGGGGRKGPRT